LLGNRTSREEHALERIALISDIHGNLPAFEATLADIDRRRITRIICLGDLAGKGPHGDVVVDRCRSHCEGVVRGNWDDGLATQAPTDPTLRWHQERLGAGRLAYFRTLPNTIDVVLSGQHVRLLHASPQGVWTRVFQEDPDEKLQAMFANTDFTGYENTPDIVAYGDIHEAFVRTFERKTLLNVGSVGNPLDQPLASYAVLEGCSGEAAAPVAITLVRLPYDIERAIWEADQEGMPDLEPYALELRTARYQRRRQASQD
jgi:protein phosphatase